MSAPNKQSFCSDDYLLDLRRRTKMSKNTAKTTSQTPTTRYTGSLLHILHGGVVVVVGFRILFLAKVRSSGS